MTAYIPYQKIPGPFKRKGDNSGVDPAIWSSQELHDLRDTLWIFTEKVDGTNIRVIWDGYRVSFGGRSDNAQIPGPLLAYLEKTFGGPDNETLFEEKFGLSEVTLYGEGYGPKIQKGGGNYRSDVSFVLFDVLIDGYFLDRSNVIDVAEFFKIDAVPAVLYGTLLEGIEFVANHYRKSHWGDFEPEGVVGVTRSGLKDRHGNRLIVKLKLRDLKDLDLTPINPALEVDNA
jgi:hypothetical protein